MKFVPRDLCDLIFFYHWHQLSKPSVLWTEQLVSWFSGFNWYLFSGTEKCPEAVNGTLVTRRLFRDRSGRQRLGAQEDFKSPTSAGRQVSYFFLLFGFCPTFSFF